MQNDKFARMAALAGGQTLATPDTPQDPSVEIPERFSPENLQRLQDEIEEERRQSTQSREELATEEEGWSSEDSIMAAQRFFSSSALGWGDEIGLWVAAIAASGTTGNPVKEVYADMRKHYDAKQEQFAREHAGAALAADIGGAIASPAMAIKAGSTLANLGLAAGEGAIYGAGASKEGQRLQDAATGALFGAGGATAVTAATKALGATANVFTRRRVEGDLVDADGDFVPITLAASDPKGVEGLIHTFYRDVVAPSFGGKGIIREQENVITGKAEALLDSQKEFAKSLDKGVKERIAQADIGMKDAGRALEAERKALKELQTNKTKDTIVPLKEKFKALNSGKADEIINKALSDVRKTTDARRLVFRDEAFANSMPASATAEDITNVLSKSDIGERARELDKLWNVKGYDVLDDRMFRFKKNELSTNLNRALESDDYFMANTVDVGGVMKEFNRIIDKTALFANKDGRVKGNVISALRSRVGQLANDAVDPNNKRAFYTLQDELDKIVQKQLKPEDAAKLSAERGKWKSTVVLREAIEGTRLDPKKRGVFDEADWLSEVAKNNRWDSRYGTGPLTKKARDLEFNLGQAEKSIARRAAKEGKKKAYMVEKTMRDHQAELQSSLAKIDKTMDAKKKALVRNPDLASEIAIDMQRQSLLKSELKTLEKDLKTLKQLRSSQNPSWFHTIAATALLTGGFLSGGPVGAALAYGSAVGAGRVLTKPTAQRVVAGQTAPQQSVQRMLQSDLTGRTADILARSGGAVSTRGMFTDE